jgi:hypothetical protein
MNTVWKISGVCCASVFIPSRSTLGEMKIFGDDFLAALVVPNFRTE